jgi:hypothetical protein
MTTTHAITATTHPVTSNRAKALGWLAHGAKLAGALKGNQAKHADAVWELIVEAVEVIDKTPDQERRWLTSGNRSGWKAPGLSRADLIVFERVRFLSGMTPYDGNATKYMPQRDDEERTLGVLAWMRWVNAVKSGDKLSRAAIELARSGDLEIVAQLYAPTRTSRHRQLAYEIKTRTVGLIEVGLRDDLGIVLSNGISFSLR